MTPIPTIIVSSSPLATTRLARDLGSLAEIRLCGQASDLSGAYIRIEETEPKLVIIGAELTLHPNFPGLLAMFRVMNITWMRLGPDRAVPAAAAAAPMLDANLPPEHLLVAIRKAMLAGPVATVSIPTPAPTQPRPSATGPARADWLILIGASTGGIDALLHILSVFPADCPPTAIVQHTGAAFSDSLIRLLDRSCAARVVAAQSGLPLEPGTVIVGAGCPGHLRLRPGPPVKTEVRPGPAVSGHLPSVDELFLSALPLAPRVVAALLTGMGRDGAEGLLALRKAGATTIAQDEASSVVYGMPRVAWEIGAAQHRLALDRIGQELLTRSTAPASETVAR
jgi:two-component system chemotaxis response regulator CheB